MRRVASHAREIARVLVRERDSCVAKVNGEARGEDESPCKHRSARPLLEALYAHVIDFRYRHGLRVHECLLGVQRRH